MGEALERISLDVLSQSGEVTPDSPSSVTVSKTIEPIGSIVVPNKPEVMLVLPPLYQTGRMPDYNPKEPMGLMYLASSLRRDGRSVELFDADFAAKTPEEVIDEITRANPPVVGFSVFQRALPSFEKIVTGLRQNGYRGHVTCGGITPTLSHPYILERLGDKVDSIVLGEGEETLRQLVGRLAEGDNWQTLPSIAWRDDKGSVVNLPAGVVNLDEIPFAARDRVDDYLAKTNYATIIGSRGCYGACSFCANYSFETAHRGPRWRPRRPATVVDEMGGLYQEHGVTVFKFNDPNMFGPGLEGVEHVRQIAQGVIDRGLPLHLMGFCRGNDLTADPTILPVMRRAGFERLLVGIESSDDAVLRQFKKGETIAGMDRAVELVAENNMSTVIGFMIFNPYTTLDSIKRDLNYLRERQFTPALSKSLRVFDGTPIQRELEQEGRLIKQNPFEGYHNYVMPREVAAVYGSMKLLFTHCLDKIRAVGQDKILNIKKAPSFYERQNFNSLSEAFFSVEADFLDRLVHLAENPGFVLGDVRHLIGRAYQDLTIICRVIGIDPKEMSAPERVTSEVYTMMKEKPFNTFREEYRWNED
ncbi:hypothetical protein A2810_02955 [candidate division Kazan bacterium RIFCSPHIGHO2_01_FULL_49_10]|uniref:Uncharacterized protein n=1 Tax=candidate division Kazan bacterium RIFCSPLOWO2_01_FULL_48_13 TaxID=1798539 RepID=A0A1F4PNX9_UNCK3|nr:MAG: hypothetical protein A2810_02955 [candidate division Kazan bacterium RIFCSPHIGHO2_01_FULL_49_10]OGB85358.1 MAG: hypothetical protein A2994_01870 [candidate division Kazan bacterium RIFCSPLOWO2_01_FULL_48_13]